VRPKYSKLSAKIGWAIIPLFILLSPTLTGTDGIFLYLPFTISTLFLGIPHGAVDHLVPRYISNKYETKDSLYWVLMLYFILGTAYTVLWFVFPSISLALFILLTILHWGQGDTYIVSKVFSARYLKNNSISVLLSVLIRGYIPMVLTYIFYTDRYIEIVEQIVTIFSERIGILYIIKLDSLPYFASVFFLLMLSVYLLTAIRNGSNSKTVLFDLSEILVLTVFFYSLPPVLSIGIYFCFWHSCRHIGRLLDSDDSLKEYDIITGCKRFMIVSAPMTFGGVVLIGLIWILLGHPISVDDQLLSIYLVGIATMTLPHSIVVVWMDIRQSIYK